MIVGWVASSVLLLVCIRLRRVGFVLAMFEPTLSRRKEESRTDFWEVGARARAHTVAQEFADDRLLVYSIGRGGKVSAVTAWGQFGAHPIRHITYQ